MPSRLWTRTPLLCLVALAALGPSAGAVIAQQGCELGPGSELLIRQPDGRGGNIVYLTRPYFQCDDDVEIWADSAVAYSTDAMSVLIGHVRYRDRSRELTSNEARYFTNVGRLQASGRVVVVDSDDGSRVENGDLVYLRQTDYRDEESMTFTTGRDGIRPRATIPPPPPDTTRAGSVAAADSVLMPDSVAIPDSAAVPDTVVQPDTVVTADSVGIPESPSAPDTAVTRERNEAPYNVVGDRIVFRGSSYFSSTGDVEIERDSLFAFADSAEYVETSESLVLVGSARVVSSEYVLVGRTITMGTDAAGTNEIRALREALLTGDDLTLTAPQIKLYLMGGAVERLVAVPLPPPGEEDAEPDSTDLARPVALAESFELTADSLELTAPEDVVDGIFAAGRARSVSQARDSLNVELLPELARRDWLEGDTIVISLKPARRDSQSAWDSAGVPRDGAVTEDERAYEIETIVARVGARSLYRLPPQDSMALAGVDPPAVHYVIGDEITIHMVEGEVESMEVQGQTHGVHLEPLSRSVAADSAAVDSLGTAPRPADGGDAPPPDRDGPGASDPYRLQWWRRP